MAIALSSDIQDLLNCIVCLEDYDAKLRVPSNYTKFYLLMINNYNLFTFTSRNVDVSSFHMFTLLKGKILNLFHKYYMCFSLVSSNFIHFHNLLIFMTLLCNVYIDETMLLFP